MERHERQAWFDKNFPDGVNVTYVFATPEDPENAQYFTPRIIVLSSDDEGFRIAFACLDVPKVFSDLGVTEVEPYGRTDSLESYLVYTDDEDVFWLTSFITPTMKERLSRFQSERPDLFEVSA